MVSQQDREILRSEIRSRSNRLSATDREHLIKPFLPEPTEISRQPRSSTSTSYQRRQKTRKTPIRTFLKSQVYHLAYAITHIFFGIVVRLLQAYHAIIDRIFAIVYHHHRTPELIRKDVRGLKRLPQHLSVILTLRVEDDALAVLMDEVAELAAWSICAGISQLSVFEKTGMKLCPSPYSIFILKSSSLGVLKSCIPALHQIITTKLASYYGSPSQQPSLQVFAPHHPVHGIASNPNTDNPSLSLLLLSSTDGRETLVDLTKTLAEMSQNGKLSPEDITPELVDAEISEITTKPLQCGGNDTVNTLIPEPDLLLVFGPFLKLDGYPPWQIRLTEMYCTGDRNYGQTGYGEAVEYQGFMRGLWHYAGAQMRFGR